MQSIGEIFFHLYHLVPVLGPQLQQILAQERGKMRCSVHGVALQLNFPALSAQGLNPTSWQPPRILKGAI